MLKRIAHSAVSAGSRGSSHCDVLVHFATLDMQIYRIPSQIKLYSSLSQACPKEKQVTLPQSVYKVSSLTILSKSLV